MNALTRIEPAAMIPYSDIERMGAVIAKSGLFGVKTVEQAVALMLIAQAEGLHPAIAARDYHVINGRPCLRSDAMLARFQQSGGKVSWDEYTDESVTGTFSHPIGGTVRVTWTLDMARKANLAGKDVWKSFPRQMLRARCISEGIRTVFPGVVTGMYAPEEIQDLPNHVGEVTSPALASSATEAIKERMKARAAVVDTLEKIGAMPPPNVEVDPATGEWLSAVESAEVDTLLAAIQAAPHSTALRSLRAQVESLAQGSPERQRAAEAYKSRSAEFKASNGDSGGK